MYFQIPAAFLWARYSIALLLVILVGCGGGGGGSDSRPGNGGDPVTPEPPQINVDSITILSQNFIASGEAILQLAQSKVEAMIELASNPTSNVLGRCTSGEAQITLDDLDTSNTLSSGDVVAIEYMNCDDPVLNDIANGQVSIVVTELTQGLYGGVQLHAEVSYQPGFTIDSDITVSGDYTLSAESTELGYTVKAQASTSEYIEVTLDQDAERFSDFDVHRVIAYTATVPRYSYGFDITMLINSTNGELKYSCDMPEPAQGQAQGNGATFAHDAEIVCQQDTGPIAKLTDSGSGLYEVAFDEDRDGTFQPADRAVFIHSLIEGFLVGNRALDLMPYQRLTAVDSTIINIKTNALVSSPTTDLLYASVSSDNAEYANSIVAINPSTGNIVDSIEFSSEPGVLALSTTGAYLYVGFLQANTIHKIALDPFGIDSTIVLGEDPAVDRGEYYTRTIAASPDDDDIIAVSLNVERLCSNCDPMYWGEAIYNRGIRAPNTNSSTGFGLPPVAANNIVFADTGAVIYATNTVDTGYEISKFTVDNDGLNYIDSLVNFAPGATVIFDNGYLLTNGGEIIDFENQSLVGSLNPVFDNKGRQIILKDSNSDRLYLAGLVLEAFDSNSLVAKGSYGTPMDSNVHSFVEVGSGLNQLAIAGDERIVLVDKASLVEQDYIDCAPVNRTEILSQQTFLSFPCAINDAVYNENSNSIYLSVAARQGSQGNRIFTLDAQSLVVTNTLAVGSEPGIMALSKDGQRLYVALDGSAQIAEINTSTQSLVRTVTLGFDQPFAGPMFVEDIDVSPDNPAQVLVSTYNRYVSTRHSGLRSYIDGVLAPTFTTRDDEENNRIEFGDFGSTAYAYNSETTEFGVRELSVTNSGVSVVSTIADGNVNGIGGFGLDIEFMSNHLFFSNGVVFDLDTSTLETDLDFSGNPRLTKVAPQVQSDTVYAYTSGSGYLPSIESFQLSTGEKQGAIRLPLLSNVSAAKSLIDIGNGRLAAVSGDGLIVIDTSLFQ